MASPIHKYLFSPPTSPRSLPQDHSSRITSPALESLASLLPPDLNLLPTRGSYDGNELKVRSPRTPRTPRSPRSPLGPQSRFTLDSKFPSMPSAFSGEDAFRMTVQDASAPSTPSLNHEGKDYLPANVPSVNVQSVSVSLSIPRPLVRLFFLASLLISSICILIYVPSARLPSLRAASASRRLAMSEDGRAYMDVMSPISSWEDSADRNYVPPQIFADRLKKRTIPPPSTERVSIPPPKANRPSAKPIPRSHEFFALQSYLLQSAYNILPASIDSALPLDANFVLGYDASEEALAELEAERAKDVVVWYGANGHGKLPHELLGLLSAVHGSNRHPTLIPMHSRPDRERLVAILERLEIPMENGAVVLIGNRPIKGDLEEIEELRASGNLEALMESIGWAEKKRNTQPWRPKLARAQKREKTEVEHALQEAKKK